MFDEDHVKINDISLKERMEIPGDIGSTQIELEWDIKVKSFIIDDGHGDVEEIQAIYNRGMMKVGKEGVKIMKDVGRYFDDGSYRIFLMWGEYKRVDREYE